MVKEISGYGSYVLHIRDRFKLIICNNRLVIHKKKRQMFRK